MTIIAVCYKIMLIDSYLLSILGEIMVIAGIVLFVLQVLAVTGSFIAGRNPFDGSLLETFSYFIIGTVGIIFIIAGKKNKK